jgi:hypothetical protein
MATQTLRQTNTINPKKCKVTVTAYLDPSAPPSAKNVQFRMDSDLKTGSRKLEFDKTKDKMKKDEDYEVQFSLNDTTGLKLTFAPSLDDALWVSAGDPVNDPPCPTSQCKNDQFRATGLSTDKMTLTVLNRDDNVEKIAFTMRFLPDKADPKDPKAYVEYDPISDNKDGGI